MLLGIVADDFTGATDLASTLVKAGMRTVQCLGVPRPGLPVPEADAVVVALKSRSTPAPDAVAQSLAAMRWLQAAGAQQLYFKYCSTFDSTDRGNIGPVADAMLDALGAPLTVFDPAFPTNRRTVYQGHLFVGDVLLSDSSMRHPPLTPMTDASLVRTLARQTPHRVGLVPLDVVERGAAAVRARLDALAADGVRHAILDTLTDAHLHVLGEACADLALVTGGSGMAMGLPANFVRAGRLASGGSVAPLPAVGGATAAIAGSCSTATQAQVARFARTHPAFAIDPLDIAHGRDVVGDALEWAVPQLSESRPVLVYSTADPERVASVQSALGREHAGALVEAAMAQIAKGLVARGVRRLVVAGGETSGAVVGALGVDALQIGPEIDPGVPWTASLGEPRLALALKSGNFGGPDFLLRAFESVR
jgi:uncharacterized protein YgbK (DUF1537 family)